MITHRERELHLSPPSSMFPRLVAVPAIRAEMDSWKGGKISTSARKERSCEKEEGHNSHKALRGILGGHQSMLEIIRDYIEILGADDCPATEECIFQSLQHMQDISASFAEFTSELSPVTAKALQRVHVSFLRAFNRTLRKLSELHATNVESWKRAQERIGSELEKSESKCRALHFDLQRVKQLNKAKEDVLKSHRKRASRLESEVSRLEGVLREGATQVLSRKTLLEKAKKPFDEPNVADTLIGKVNGLSFILDKFDQQELQEGTVLNQMEQLLMIVRAKGRLGHYSRTKAGHLEIKPVKPTSKIHPAIPNIEENGVPAVHNRGTMTYESALSPGFNNVGRVEGLVFVTGSVCRHNLWWRAFNFARCRKCRTLINDCEQPKTRSTSLTLGQCDKAISGKGDRQTVTSSQTNDLDTSDLNLTKIQQVFRTDDGEEKFQIPPDFVAFIVHLPQDFVEMKAQPLDWLHHEIDSLYSMKYHADMSDKEDGVQLQSLNTFLIEHFLFKYELRRLAEVRIFELLRSTYAHMKNPEVRLFAQFLGAVPLTLEQSPVSLENDTLLVILHVRHFLKRKTSGNSDEEGPTVKVHNDKAYVTLDVAISAIKPILQQFLSPRKLSLHCRYIENLSYIETTYTNANGDTTVTLERQRSVSSGNRMTVRLKMRSAMIRRRAEGKCSGQPNPSQPTQPSTGASSSYPTESKTKKVAVVHVHDVLMSMVKLLQLRKKAVKAKLQKAFVVGDEDGNGVLSFSEFEVIIEKLNSTMPRRQILRLFRSAVTANAGNTLSITPEVFERVCKAHDVLPLVDFNNLSSEEKTV